MSKEDKIKELFEEKLGTHEVPVNPDLWNAIASQIGTSVATTSIGLSLLTKAIIAISAASIIGASAYFITRNDATHEPLKQSIQQSKSTEKTNELEADEMIEQSTQTNVRSSDSSPSAPNTEQSSADVASVAVQEFSTTEPFKDSKQTTGTDQPSTFTNQPSPNLVGEKPSSVFNTESASTSKKEVKQIPHSSTNKDLSASKADEEHVSEFELTNLPNVYVLNARGYFSIGYKGEYSDFQFTIMDNNHVVIYRTDRPDFEWTGTNLYGNQIEPGKYVYIVTAKDKKGNAINKYSTLTVINQ